MIYQMKENYMLILIKSMFNLMRKWNLAPTIPGDILQSNYNHRPWSKSELELNPSFAMHTASLS